MTGPLSSDQPIQLTVEARAHGWRVDHYLSRLFPNYSREMFKKAIDEGRVLVNGLSVKPSRRLRVNDVLSVRLPELPDRTLKPENIPLDVLYEDDQIAVINKPSGMIVHPGRGNYGGTLAAALQFHFDRLSDAAGQYRAGIVHRLDRDTSGVLVVAKDNQVHYRLSRQFEQREVVKEYRAIVWGNVEFDSDYIETFVRVNPKKREKMMVCPPGENAREAVTFYEVLERFDGFTYVRLLPKTGRTHQLRVHMQHLGHPIVADGLYGGGTDLRRSDLTGNPAAAKSRARPKPEVRDQKSEVRATKPADRARPDPFPDDDEPLELTPDEDILIARQALHALRLEFRHPESGQPLSFEAPLPEDIERTLEALRTLRPAK